MLRLCENNFSTEKLKKFCSTMADYMIEDGSAPPPDLSVQRILKDFVLVYPIQFLILDFCGDGDYVLIDAAVRSPISGSKNFGHYSDDSMTIALLQDEDRFHLLKASEDNDDKFRYNFSQLDVSLCVICIFQHQTQRNMRGLLRLGTKYAK